jgi:hypothetical protein
MNSYENTTIQMQTTKRFTENIIIGKGVKQRYPLSTSLFNLGIDPLIRNIRENYQKCGDGHDSQEKKGYTSIRR